eukprot:g37820.t1
MSDVRKDLSWFVIASSSLAIGTANCVLFLKRHRFPLNQRWCYAILLQNQSMWLWVVWVGVMFLDTNLSCLSALWVQALFLNGVVGAYVLRTILIQCSARAKEPPKDPRLSKCPCFRRRHVIWLRVSFIFVTFLSCSIPIYATAARICKGLDGKHLHSLLALSASLTLPYLTLSPARRLHGFVKAWTASPCTVCLHCPPRLPYLTLPYLVSRTWAARICNGLDGKHLHSCWRFPPLLPYLTLPCLPHAARICNGLDGKPLHSLLALLHGFVMASTASPCTAARICNGLDGKPLHSLLALSASLVFLWPAGFIFWVRCQVKEDPKTILGLRHELTAMVSIFAGAGLCLFVCACIFSVSPTSTSATVLYLSSALLAALAMLCCTTVYPLYYQRHMRLPPHMLASVTLDQILSRKTARDAFAMHLEAEYCVELLLYLEAIETLRPYLEDIHTRGKRVSGSDGGTRDSTGTSNTYNTSKTCNTSYTYNTANTSCLSPYRTRTTKCFSRNFSRVPFSFSKSEKKKEREGVERPACPLSALEAKLRRLYQEFLSPEAPNAVNLHQDLLNRCQQLLQGVVEKSPSETTSTWAPSREMAQLLLQTRLEAHGLLQHGSLPRFLASPSASTALVCLFHGKQNRNNTTTSPPSPPSPQSFSAVQTFASKVELSPSSGQMAQDASLPGLMGEEELPVLHLCLSSSDMQARLTPRLSSIPSLAPEHSPQSQNSTRGLSERISAIRSVEHSPISQASVGDLGPSLSDIPHLGRSGSPLSEKSKSLVAPQNLKRVRSLGEIVVAIDETSSASLEDMPEISNVTIEGEPLAVSVSLPQGALPSENKQSVRKLSKSYSMDFGSRSSIKSFGRPTSPLTSSNFSSSEHMHSENLDDDAEVTEIPLAEEAPFRLHTNTTLCRSTTHEQLRFGNSTLNSNTSASRLSDSSSPPVETEDLKESQEEVYRTRASVPGALKLLKRSASESNQFNRRPLPASGSACPPPTPGVSRAASAWPQVMEPHSAPAPPDHVTGHVTEHGPSDNHSHNFPTTRKFFTSSSQPPRGSPPLLPSESPQKSFASPTPSITPPSPLLAATRLLTSSPAMSTRKISYGSPHLIVRKLSPHTSIASLPTHPTHLTHSTSSPTVTHSRNNTHHFTSERRLERVSSHNFPPERSLERLVSHNHFTSDRNSLERIKQTNARLSRTPQATTRRIARSQPKKNISLTPNSATRRLA